MDQKKKFDEYLEYITNAEESILFYLENEDINDQFFLNLMKIFQENEVLTNKYELSIILHLISKIINNHHHTHLFYPKITKIINKMKISIKNFFSNSDIFKMFKGNKRFLLILKQNQIFYFDETIANIIKNSTKSESYIQFFYPEMKPYFDDIHNETYENDQTIFDNYRDKGENHNYICQLIQSDLVEEFISYVTRANYDLSSKIKPSIFETNSFLLKKNEVTLIEYAVYFGSIQIFQFLKMNNVQLKPSLWLYAIHSNNAELIHILEECHIKPENETYEDCYIESIKCHHNNLAEYIKNNYLSVQSVVKDLELFRISIKKYNFYDICLRICDESFDLYDWSKIDEISELTGISILYDFCKYDYFKIVEFLAKNTNINLNIRIHEEYNQTALFLSVLNEKNDFIELLLSCPNIDVNINRIDGEEIYSLLNYVLNNQKISIAKKMLSNPSVDVNSYSFKKNEFDTALCTAIAKGNDDIVDILLNNPKIDINAHPKDSVFEHSKKYGETPLNMAIKKENFHVVSQLLSKKNIDVNLKSISQNKEETALNIAIEKENIEFVKLLLQNKNIDVNSFSIIKTPKENGNESHIEVAPVHLAIEKENLEILKLLFCHQNVDANLKSYYCIQKKELKSSQERTVIQTAIDKKNIDIIKFLLTIPKVDVNLKSSYGYEKMMFFEDHDTFNEKKAKDLQAIKILISPLYLAVEENQFEIVKLLLSRPEIDTKCKSEYWITKSYFSEKDSNGTKYYSKQYDSKIMNEVILNNF